MSNTITPLPPDLASLRQQINHLLNKLLVEADSLSTPSDHFHQLDGASIGLYFHYFKSIGEKHQALKIILHNLATLLSLTPPANSKERRAIDKLLQQAEQLVDKPIDQTTITK